MKDPTLTAIKKWQKASFIYNLDCNLRVNIRDKRNHRLAARSKAAFDEMMRLMKAAFHVEP